MRRLSAWRRGAHDEIRAIRGPEWEFVAWHWQIRYLYAEPHFVYRHLDAAGDLLYVGVTHQPRRRPVQRNRPWFAEVERVLIDGPYLRHIALELERRVILDQRPPHNLSEHNGALAMRSWRARAQAILDGRPRHECEDAWDNPPAPVGLPVLTEIAQVGA